MNIELIETSEVNFENPLAIVGFPDVGLVGTIAVSHIIEILNLQEIAHIDSEELPPIVVVKGRRPRGLIRIYGNEKLICIISETPIPPSLTKAIAKKIVEWLKNKNANLVVSIGGLAHPERMEIEKPKVYGVPADSKTEELLEKNGVSFFEEGFLVGPNGVVVFIGKNNNLPAIHLVCEAYFQFPDPGAAAATIEVLNKMFGLNINVEKLREKEEEIRLKTRELMKRTQEILKEMQKKEEVPVMYR